MIDGSEVIDFHGHVGSWDSIGMTDDAETMLRTMDAAGVDKACLFNIFDADSRESNNRTIAFTSKHPERFIPFAYIWPESADKMVSEAKRAIDELGCKAFKTYPPYTAFTLDDRRWDPLYEFVQERGLALITHTSSEWQSYPKYLGESARRFPGATFIAGPQRQCPRIPQPGDRGGADASEFLPGDVLHLQNTRRHRAARQRRRR